VASASASRLYPLSLGTRRTLGVGAFLVLCTLRAGDALAKDPVERARELFHDAEEAERRKEFASALSQFRAVGEIRMTPSVRFHIAHCEAELGQLAAAQTDYETAKKEAEAKNQRETANAADKALLTLVPRVPKIMVHCTRPGCGVRLDGKLLDPEKWKAPISVDPGAHVVEAFAEGAPTYRKELTLKEREVARVDAELPEKDPAKVVPPSPSVVVIPMGPSSAPPTSTAPPKTTPPPAATVSHGSELPPADEEPRAKKSRVPAILATGGAALFLGTGIATFLVAGSAQSDGEASCRELLACDRSKRSVRAWDAVSLGSFIAAGGLGTLAVILWVTSSSSGSTKAQLQITPTSISATGHF
jgi:hypothetical protein